MSAPPGFNASASMLPDPGASSAPIQVMRGGGQRSGFGAQEIETLKKYGLYETGVIARQFTDEEKRAFLTELDDCNWGSGNAVITNGRCKTVTSVLRALLLKRIGKVNGKALPQLASKLKSNISDEDLAPSASLADAYAELSPPNVFEPSLRRSKPDTGISGAPVEEMSISSTDARINPLGRGNRVRMITGARTKPTGMNQILARRRVENMGQPAELTVRNIEYNSNNTDLSHIRPNEDEVQTVKYELNQAVAKATKLEKTPSTFNCSKPSNTQNTFGYNTTKDMLFKNYNTNTGKLRVYGRSAKNIKTRGAYETRRAKIQKTRNNARAQQQKANANLLKSKQVFQFQAQKQTKSNVVKRLERELAEFKATAPPVESQKKPGFFSRAKSLFKRGGKRSTRKGSRK